MREKRKAWGSLASLLMASCVPLSLSAMNLKQTLLLLEKPRRSPTTMLSKGHRTSTRRMQRISTSGTIARQVENYELKNRGTYGCVMSPLRLRRFVGYHGFRASLRLAEPQGTVEGRNSLRICATRYVDSGSVVCVDAYILLGEIRSENCRLCFPRLQVE